MSEPLFTADDIPLLHAAAHSCREDDFYVSNALGLPAGPHEEELALRYESLAERIQRWLDERGTPLEPGTMTYQFRDHYGCPIGERIVVKVGSVIDETDPSEG